MSEFEEMIKAKLNQMHKTDCHEDFERLMNALNDDDSLAILLNVINKYDRLARSNFGKAQTIQNLKEKYERLSFTVYGEKLK